MTNRKTKQNTTAAQTPWKKKRGLEGSLRTERKPRLNIKKQNRQDLKTGVQKRVEKGKRREKKKVARRKTMKIRKIPQGTRKRTRTDNARERNLQAIMSREMWENKGQLTKTQVGRNARKHDLSKSRCRTVTRLRTIPQQGKGGGVVVVHWDDQ